MAKKKSAMVDSMSSLEDRINRELAMMKHKDLQAACISRGLEFDNVLKFSHHDLANWFYKNYERSENPQLLNEYDAWVEEQLQKRGYKKGDAIMSPHLRLGFVPPMSDIPEPRIIKPENSENNKPKIVKTEKRKKDESTGVYSGTKKNLTYQLTDEGKTTEEIIKAVIEKFPDAQEKSIKIWIKRRLNGG